MEKYKDPEQSDKLAQDILKITKLSTLQYYIDNLFPGWLVISLNKYCSDYPHFQNNWEKICKLSGIEPNKIILVSDIFFDDDHKLMRLVCEHLTKHGCVVRRISEFVACEVCNAAIPCLEIYDQLRNRNIKTPKIWSRKCSEC